MYAETPATTATLPFRIVSVGANYTDSTAAYSQIVVQFNNALSRASGAQTGIS